MSEDDQTRRAALIQDAFARGQSALAAGDNEACAGWIARIDCPTDGTIALVLASATLGVDNEKAASLFAEVTAAADVRDAWLGLATTRFLMRDMVGATEALSPALSRHAARPGASDLAAQLVNATGAPGWCELTSDGRSASGWPVSNRLRSISMDSWSSTVCCLRHGRALGELR